jgi:putative IMPACT (imprinted ancient) family translation regulator
MNTVKKETEISFEEKKSKFIGYIKPVTSAKEAEEFISYIKTRHPNATHNCSCYRKWTGIL